MTVHLPQESYTKTVKISIAETLGDEYVDMFETVETVEKYNPISGIVAQAQAAGITDTTAALDVIDTIAAAAPTAAAPMTAV